MWFMWCCERLLTSRPAALSSTSMFASESVSTLKSGLSPSPSPSITELISATNLYRKHELKLLLLLLLLLLSSHFSIGCKTFWRLLVVPSTTIPKLLARFLLLPVPTTTPPPPPPPPIPVTAARSVAGHGCRSDPNPENPTEEEEEEEERVEERLPEREPVAEAGMMSWLTSGSSSFVTLRFCSSSFSFFFASFFSLSTLFLWYVCSSKKKFQMKNVAE